MLPTGPRPSLLAELLQRQRLLTVYALLMVALMVPTVLLCSLDERTIRGVAIWGKPLKFMASTALFAVTTAWFMALLPQSVRSGKTIAVIVWTIIATSLFEVVYISFQAALGSASHYNVSDLFHAIMFGLMALAAVLLTGSQAALAWQIARFTPQRPYSVATWSVIAGLTLTFILATSSGLMLGGHQPPAGSGLPIVGWHLNGNDARPAHFLGVHAQQLIPLAGVWLNRLPSARGRVALAVACIVYVAAWMYLLGLSNSGH